MRHLPIDCLESTLRQGATLEQFVGSAHPEGERLIRWIELVPSINGIEVWDYTVPAFSQEGADFDALADGEFKPVAVVADPVQALEFTQSELGAQPTRWVRQCLTQELSEQVLPGFGEGGAPGRRRNP